MNRKEKVNCEARTRTLLLPHSDPTNFRSTGSRLLGTSLGTARPSTRASGAGATRTPFDTIQRSLRTNVSPPEHKRKPHITTRHPVSLTTRGCHPSRVIALLTSHAAACSPAAARCCHTHFSHAAQFRPRTDLTSAPHCALTSSRRDRTMLPLAPPSVCFTLWPSAVRPPPAIA